MSVYMRNLLKTQDSLRKAAAKKLLRTDLLHMTHEKQLQHTDYQPGTYVIVPGPGSRSYRVPTLPDPAGYYYCTLQLGC